MRGFAAGEGGASSALGTILMVAVTIVLAVSVGVFALDIGQRQGAPTAEAAFEYEPTPAGLSMTATHIGEDVAVELNGQRVAGFNASDAGKTVLLPTAPGDRVTVVSREGGRSVLVNKRIDDRSEVGDLVAYYSFDQGSTNTIVDRSGNGNDGTAYGNYSRIVDDTGSALQFDGQSGTHVDLGDLTVDGPASVDEITIAIKYSKRDGSDDIQNLVEHQAGNFAWYLETDGQHVAPHRMEYTIGYLNPPSGTLYAPSLAERSTHVLVATFDGDEMVLYRNGTRLGSTPLDRDVALGDVVLAADSNPSMQNFRGRMYQVRLYYTAFDDREAAVLSKAMGNESTSP
ncbi:LamG-like jellyroll fold domain-containing protein [Halorubellus sp. PRR65]|uniref:LamG-like jellyroll fold domain-containing protein n=1 Tax=Halorubellus sp. PRR65 TaxID=3098148 RepID=UPI002B256EE2|nr:LamG-like jellyroll fold domain-containing protein [Halorubellus sp. PRR65]